MYCGRYLTTDMFNMLAKLFYSTIVFLSFRFISSIVLNINDEKQPLICELSTENKYFSITSAIYDPDNPKELLFLSETEARLITACPLEILHSDVPEMLVETIKNEKSCKDTLVPVTTHLSIDVKCGTNEEGSWYAAGYQVRTLKPFLNQNIHFGAVYYICYSEFEGVLYTLHSIFSGKRVNPFTTWINANKETKFKSDLISNLKHKVDLEDENVYEIQLVPFDDMIPMPWKFATLFTFNFISTNKRVKTAFDELDKYLRNYTEKTLSSLQIVSGIKTIPKRSTSDEINWYWRMIVNQSIQIIFMVADEEPKSNEVQIQCENPSPNENISLYDVDIPNLLCCKALESTLNDLNITLSGILNKPYLFT